MLTLTLVLASKMSFLKIFPWRIIKTLPNCFYVIDIFLVFNRPKSSLCIILRGPELFGIIKKTTQGRTQ